MNLLFPIIFLPLISFLIIIFSKEKFSKIFYNFFGVFPTFICFILTNYIFLNYFNSIDKNFENVFWNWIIIDKIHINFGFFIDRLSLIMLELITGVGFLIQIFSIWYMSKKFDLSRFFSYINLFIFGMILLVLSDNFLLMYLAWELVGFCSYALIGFYYKDLDNIKSSMKAFIVTRIGDLFILLAIFLIFLKYNTLNFVDLHSIFYKIQKFNINYYQWIAFCILIGAIAKSSQFPLQTWLLKAMVGPTPVSALIHSATMITAGVYLILRTYFLFELSNRILFLISLLGSCTILISSFSAIFEKDIKKILAYSTMSQVGYMFLGLGMKLWIPVISHVVSHSFFKALLFLSSGSLIHSCYNEKNIFKMGGSRKNLLFLYICFIIGLFSLISFPIITASFYTKGSIIWESFNKGYYYFFIIGLIGSFFTAIYSSRMFFLIFYRFKRKKIRLVKNCFHFFSLFILCLLSSFLSIILFYPMLKISILVDLLNFKKMIFEFLILIFSFFGVFLSYYFFVLKYKKTFYFLNKKKYFNYFKFLEHSFGLDYFYKNIFIKPFNYISKILSIDYIKNITKIFILILKLINNFLLIFENGKLNLYILSIFTGSITIFLYLLI
ncbi:MAG: NADH-quinone oxidoreductase subunit L [Buchnera aphidicola (Periphyllus acericola)]|uniref:NADH-quinone oxidoreductase subunit L n=1 Tax=Buchnera aphidicola TaxID=9 RepID=UPI0030CB6170|nr:NADH-quinone oxidoreductase subunit L [Buchnera aphidicola (Periphyllus acericola)]